MSKEELNAEISGLQVEAHKLKELAAARKYEIQSELKKLRQYRIHLGRELGTLSELKSILLRCGDCGVDGIETILHRIEADFENGDNWRLYGPSRPFRRMLDEDDPHRMQIANDLASLGEYVKVVNAANPIGLIQGRLDAIEPKIKIDSEKFRLNEKLMMADNRLKEIELRLKLATAKLIALESAAPQ